MIFSLELLLVITLITISMIASLIIEHKKIKYLHGTSFSIVLGIIASLFINIFNLMEKTMDFDAEVFFNIMLPPIIFAAGYTLKKQEFFDNFPYILLYGILGTIIVFIILTFMAAFFNIFDFIIGSDEKLNIADCMLLACVLASTDTVAALAILKADKYPKLNSILFGEGVINDAVSILLFRTVRSYFVNNMATTGETPEFTWSMLFSIGWNFFYLSLLSLAVGIFLGLILSYVFKKFHTFREQPLIETCMIMLTGYTSYLIPEILHLSGIISLFSCGVALSHYAMLNMSKTSQKGTVLTFDAVSYLAETFVFIYLGITIVNFKTDQVRVIFTLLMTIAVFFSRLISTFGPPIFYYMITKKDTQLILKELKLLWYSGLVRGAIAFALCDQVISSQKGIIMSATLGIVLITTFGLTIYLENFMKYIGFGDNSFEMDEIADMHQLLMRSSTDGESEKIELPSTKKLPIKSVLGNSIQESNKLGIVQKKWMHFDQKIMQPTFGKKREVEDSGNSLELPSSNNFKM